MPSIYSPAEDSYLMQKVLKEKIPSLLKKTPNLKVLEVGAGSGIQIVVLQQLGVKNIFSSDINSQAVAQCKKLGFECVQSDLFEGISGKYNLIIFNPPYLPDDKSEPSDSKVATTGGKNGSEIINEFLIQAKKYLEKDGRIFLLASSLTKKINWQDYQKIQIAEDDLFMEKLFVWEVWI